MKAGNFKPFVPAIFDSLPCIKKAAEIEDFNVGQEVQRFQRSAPQPASNQKQNKVSTVCLKKTLKHSFHMSAAWALYNFLVTLCF